MITRQEYMFEKKCSFREYYAQFVTERERNIVKKYFGLKRLKEHFAYVAEDSLHPKRIPVEETSIKGGPKTWDSLAPAVQTRKIASQLRECGDYLTLAGCVCVLKEAALQVVEKK